MTKQTNNQSHSWIWFCQNFQRLVSKVFSAKIYFMFARCSQFPFGLPCRCFYLRNFNTTVFRRHGKQFSSSWLLLAIQRIVHQSKIGSTSRCMTLQGHTFVGFETSTFLERLFLSFQCGNPNSICRHNNWYRVSFFQWRTIIVKSRSNHVITFSPGSVVLRHSFAVAYPLWGKRGSPLRLCKSLKPLVYINSTKHVPRSSYLWLYFCSHLQCEHVFCCKLVLHCHTRWHLAALRCTWPW